MINRVLAALALILAMATGVAGRTSIPAPNDYATKANWLCWPRATPNACEVDLSTTVVKADGSTRAEAFKADPKSPIIVRQEGAAWKAACR